MLLNYCDSKMTSTVQQGCYHEHTYLGGIAREKMELTSEQTCIGLNCGSALSKDAKAMEESGSPILIHQEQADQLAGAAS